ncbi:hypothetical protein [Cesiribacter sp. SM1]|uniref:hypothetical protein n=1 Tax=Cesiribacter sp. SM1 TaxID=2861196 RepID=UPI001CD65B95|nr:hypothetical protein [Cesiribacter sp. SM1]
MKRSILNITLLLCLVIACFSCEDDLDYGQFSRDNQPAIPVTYQGATTYGHAPFYTVSKTSESDISFTLEIPESSGRTIREITRVVGGTTAINAATVTTGATAANTIQASIAGSGTTATFTTSLPALKAKFPTGAANTALNGPTGTATYSEFAFMFLVTLDDNQTIVPVQLRLRIAP